MKYYLLTWHGYFVGSSVNSAIHLDPNVSADQLLCIEIDPSLQPNSFADFLGNTPPLVYEAILPGVGSFSLHPQEFSNVVAFQSDNRYLSARPDGSLACDRDQILGWEKFVLVSEESLRQLQHILSESWVIASTRTFVPKDLIRIEHGPSLRIGPLMLALGPNLPFDNHFSPFRFPVHPEGWKFDQIMLYRPIIFYVAVGEDAIGQLCVSLNSLFQIGKYDGRVFVFTDTSEEELRTKLVEIAPWQLRVAPVPANERVGFVAARYAILEEETAYQCSPVAYMDTDIVFNTDVQQLLVHMICAGRPSAPLEHWSNLAASPSVGAQLIRQDNGNPALASGFNNGTFAVPNLKEFGHVISIIRRTLQNYLSLKGRDALPYLDQEVANYVSFKFAHFDTSQISRYVRFGWMDDAATLGLLSGLVHFCGIPRQYRLESMRRYYDLLADHYKVPHNAARDQDATMVQQPPSSVKADPGATNVTRIKDCDVRFYGDGENRFGKLLREFCEQFSQSAAQPTVLCELMSQQGSDKGNGWHNYTLLYDRMLGDRRHSIRNVFEVGIGKNSGASSAGLLGASLRGWRGYFPNANVVGADVGDRTLPSGPGISTLHVDQSDEASIQDLWSKFPDLVFDIIIDDGVHSFEANSTFMAQSLHKVEKDGFYILEDIVTRQENVESFDNFFRKLTTLSGFMIRIPHETNKIDNCIAFFQR